MTHRLTQAIAVITLLTLGSALTASASAGTGTSPLVIPQNASIGPAGLHRPILAFYRTWGSPTTLARMIPPSGQTATVVTWKGPSVSLVVSFRDRAQRDASGISYRGPFHTSKGDHRGTTLQQFMAHWPNAQPRVGALTVGRTTFTLDSANRLSGIELGIPPPFTYG